MKSYVQKGQNPITALCHIPVAFSLYFCMTNDISKTEQIHFVVLIYFPSDLSIICSTRISG